MSFLLVLRSLKSARTVLLVAVLTAISSGPIAQAVEIVYDGFGYPTGYLAIADASTQVLIDDFGITDAGIYDGIDDGTGGFYDHDGDSGTPEIQATVLGDPARAGGSGSWVSDAGWIRRTVTSWQADRVDGDSTLSYTDSSGNQLATTMGKPVFTDYWGIQWRAFDASTVTDPAYPAGLTIPNTGSENTISAIDFEVPTLGKQGTVVWFSFLADEQSTGGTGSNGTEIQLYNKRDAVSLTETPKDRTAGINKKQNGTDWRFYDTKQGEEGNHAVGTSGDIVGSGAADAAGDLFLVAKFDYGATTGSDTDGWADITFWVNPDLDAEPLAADAALTTSGYIPFNGFAIFQGGGAGGDPASVTQASSIEELRLGTTYADVAPIAAGLDGDFDVDGDVDGNDFLVWQRGAATPADLALWQGNYGAPNSSAAAGAVPEPTSILLLSFAGILCYLRRR